MSFTTIYHIHTWQRGNVKKEK